MLLKQRVVWVNIMHYFRLAFLLVTKEWNCLHNLQPPSFGAFIEVPTIVLL
jgi:hypothetical protein